MAKFPWYHSEKEHLAWSETRKKGKWKFVIFRGVIAWGLPMLFVMGFTPVCFGFPHQAESTVEYWIIQSLLWTAGGFLFGFSMWRYTEKQFLKYEREKRDP